MTQVTRELIELAERVEKAEGADRRLDVLIGCAVGYVPDTPGCEWAKSRVWQYVPVPKISERIGAADKAGNVAAHWEAPAYTVDLNAAMSLVPDNTGWAHWSPIGKRPSVAIETDAGWGDWHSARTLPLALVAAALRARSAATL